MSIKEKKVSFFRAVILADGRRHLGVVDWRSHLVETSKLPMKERTHEGIVYDPHVSDDALLLGVHAPIKPDFLSHIDPAKSTITDYMDAAAENEDGGDGDGDDAGDGGPKQFANSTAVAFMGIGNVLGIALGNAHAPRSGSVRAFLEHFVPLGEGQYWKVEPLMDPGNLKTFQEEAEGISAFSATFSTSQDLLNTDDATGPVGYGDRIAKALGGEVEVEIRISLAPGAKDNRSVKQRFRDFVARDLPRLVSNPRSGTKVTALLDGNIEEEIDLVAHRLASTIEIDDSVSESTLFSSLLEALRDVSAAREDHVRWLLGEGG